MINSGCASSFNQTEASVETESVLVARNDRPEDIAEEKMTEQKEEQKEEQSSIEPCVVNKTATLDEIQRKRLKKIESKPEDDFIEETRKRLGRWVFNTSEYIDRFLADDKFLEVDAPYSRMTLKPYYTFLENGKSETGTDVRIKWVLPRSENRFSLFFEGSQSNEIETQPGEVAPIEQTGPNSDSNRLGAEFTITQEELWDSKVYGGFTRRDGHRVGFAGIRWRRIIDFANSQGELSQFVYFYDREGYGETSRYDWIIGGGNPIYWSTRTQVTYGEETLGAEWFQRFALNHILSDTSFIRYSFNIEGHTQPESITDQFYIDLLWRTYTWREWFYWELNPRIAWPYLIQYDEVASFYVGMGIEFF